MKFVASTCFALVLAVSTSVSVSAHNTTASDARVLQQGSDVAQQILTAINTARAQSGLSALCLNTKLTAASQQQANSMAAGGYISPVGQDGSMPTERAQALGFDTQAVFEVVGAGYKNPSVAVSEWLKLADRDQYLLGDFKFLGAAKAVNNQQQYRSFWVVDLSQDDGEEQCA